MTLLRRLLPLLLLGSTLAGAAPPPEPGVMLRSGNWDGGIGTFEVPAAFAKLPPARWPADGWHRVTVLADRLEVAPVAVPGRRKPAFLQAITTQVAAGVSGSGDGAGDAAAGNTAAEERDVLFLRFPGLKLRTGSVPVHLFRNGTSRLSPKLDFRYELTLSGQPFALTVQNGLVGRNGARYGSGARYTIEYDGNRYEYTLGEFGWDSRIGAIADLDGDGKPDFLIGVSGNNTSFEYLLLSSLAKPGTNPPSASLQATGC